MNKQILFFLLITIAGFMGCNKQTETPVATKESDNFKYVAEQFADLQVLRYQVPGFENLTAKQKELVYYLYEASLAGKDIFYDQNNKYNLRVRKTIEAIATSFNGDKNSEDYKNFLVYAKRVWFSNGIHHHYANDKFIPAFSKEFFTNAVKGANQADLPLTQGQSVDQFISELIPVMFDSTIMSKKVDLSSNKDIIKSSAVNFYEGVTQKEVESYYDKLRDKNDSTPISYGLNSKMMKEGGKIVEKKWMVGGMYSPAIEKIVYWLEKAVPLAENEIQKASFQKLIEYYKTGDLKTWDEYNILWVQDTTSIVDLSNGFIEQYNDPLGYRGSYESIVSIKDMESTKRIDAIGKEAQYFEDNSPIDKEYKKENVVGISAKVITVVVETGDAAPATPIGINLPNANWIRAIHGSKSVTLSNIVDAYNHSISLDVVREFAWTEDEVQLTDKYGAITDNLHTDMHEAIGHASGKIKPGVGGPKLSLKNYGSAIEEARADLVALYYMPDQKLLDLGVMPDKDAFKAEYIRYIRNGLQYQLNRIEPGNNIEESHMRNRQAIANWVYEQGAAEKTENGTGVVEKRTRDGKIFFVINDYQKLRQLFGRLLKEIQRITSEGDFNGAKAFIETYGVKVDKDVFNDVKARYSKLNVPPYKGFIQPVLKPVIEGGKIVDVKIEYPEDFMEQMLNYGKNYSFLPALN